MNVLITGIAGLLGSRLADWIQKNTKHTVIGIDDLSGGFSISLTMLSFICFLLLVLLFLLQKAMKNDLSQ